MLGKALGAVVVELLANTRLVIMTATNDLFAFGVDTVSPGVAEAGESRITPRVAAVNI